ncbi:MAG: 23S rRNA (uracil(1939)-C(5))-methyltransferase RlmD, partial [Pseudomonadales bacterium]
SELMLWLAKQGPEKVLYISCHPATMVRDIQLLSQDYRIEKVGAMNMFPHTTHLEAMTLLVKR